MRAHRTPSPLFAAGLPDSVPDSVPDFDRINTILAEMVGGVQADLAAVWFPFRMLVRLLGDIDDAIVNFSMQRARDHAWRLAEELAALDGAARAEAIARRDNETLELAKLVRNPGVFGGLVAKAIRLGERGSVSRILDLLG